ncbi:hypothetical protein HMPREF1863_00696 [Aedoeadaptatus coxii]|uniref:Uncharacterized protein n=1 Tax=Aedoeadaptatus coxii TaxID=755172 RepID=A0A134AH01_9FIRM|nr:hypothetical protein HMPREF1863_00696 [Peptoniphilus coxii]
MEFIISIRYLLSTPVFNVYRQIYGKYILVFPLYVNCFRFMAVILFSFFIFNCYFNILK